MNLNMHGTIEVTLDTGEKYIYDDVIRAENIDGELTLHIEDGPAMGFGPGVWEQAVPVEPPAPSDS